MNTIKQLFRLTVLLMILSAHYTKSTAQDTTRFLNESIVGENKKLKRDGVKLFAIIDRMQSELKILQESNDSCSSIVLGYQEVICNMQSLYSVYDTLVSSKDATIELDKREIRILKRKSLLLRIKFIATGIAIPVITTVAGISGTYLYMKSKDN